MNVHTVDCQKQRQKQRKEERKRLIEFESPAFTSQHPPPGTSLPGSLAHDILFNSVPSSTSLSSTRALGGGSSMDVGRKGGEGAEEKGSTTAMDERMALLGRLDALDERRRLLMSEGFSIPSSSTGEKSYWELKNDLRRQRAENCVDVKQPALRCVEYAKVSPSGSASVANCVTDCD